MSALDPDDRHLFGRPADAGALRAGQNAPPAVRPLFASEEQSVAWERFRAATEALHAAELAHQQQAATLHAAVLAPAQAEFRAALAALTQSIAPRVP